MLDPRMLDPRHLPPDPLAMSKAPQDRVRPSATHQALFRAQSRFVPGMAAKQSIKPMTAGATAVSGVTGTNPWWPFVTGAVPGVGTWAVNAATGNLLITETDVDVPGRGGVDLNFSRTYNSLSQHDSAGTDGSLPSNFGNGWTNSFDAHLSYNANTNVMTVWSGDGARFDYTSDGAGGWLAPAGQRAILKFDGGCGYLWIQKDGSELDFSAPNYSSICPGASLDSAYNGRLYEILGRNRNNRIVFSYSWLNNDASTAGNLTQTVAANSDGQQLVLTFGLYSGYRELQSVTRPDGAQITYQYDTYGGLAGVFEPVNNSNYGYHQYQYWSGEAHQLLNIVSPEYAQNGGAKGGVTTFWNNGGIATGVALSGWGNFMPDDGTNTALQPALAQQSQQLTYTGFGYPSAGETQLTDSYGRATNWFYDGAGRITEEDDWSGYPNNTWLKTYATWNQGLNVPSETVDARGNATDYGWDGNANLLRVQQPMVQTSQGGGRPVARFTYDQYNNLLSYCDPQYVWSTGATTCPSTGGTAHYTWNTSDGNEPYGYLTDAYNARGYHSWFSYNTNAQGGGDYGLITDMNSDCIAQADGTSRCPHTGISYNGYGNATYYGAGVGNWTLTYDNLNRLTSATDPDGATACQWYYANNQISATETPAERAASGVSGQCNPTAVNPESTAQTYTYDADGNELTETHHFNNSQTTTTKWYDGADRLVEVALPQDPNDIFSSWLTRYVYDISNSSNAQLYGNLANVQRYVPNTASQTGTTVSAGYAWVPVKAWNYDALDRVIKRLYFPPGAGSMSTDTWNWDTRGAGLLASFSNAAGDSVTYSYDTIGNVTRRDYNSANSIYSGALPSDIVQYDPDSRVAMYENYEVGPAFYTYDGDGNVATYTEPAGGSGTPLGGVSGSISDATKYTYSYYLDDMMQQLSASSSVLSSYSQQYSYRTDGLLEAQLSSANWTSAGTAYGATYAWNETFTNAGRVTYKSDTLTDPCAAGQTCRHTMAYNGTSGLPYALTAGYDAYGRISSWALPSGTYSNWTYDDEGEPTGFTAGNQNFSLGYSTRGELLSEKSLNPPYTDAPPNVSFRSADGFLYSTSPLCVYSDQQGYDRCAVPTLTFDPRNGTLLSSSHLFVSQITGNIGCCQTTTYSYDLAGRRSGREYDALNRLLKSGSLAYAYGPGTIPISHNAFTNHASLGAMPLYVTDSSGVIQDLKFGMNSDVVPTDSSFNGLTVYDRDPFGFSAAQRNSSGTSAWTMPDMFSSCDTSGTIGQASTGYKATATSNCSPNGPLYAFRTDGYFDGSLTFRGVRTYDSDTQQWSTPDAYQGSADDPMSGLGYNYAGNNPAMFADPSGFDSVQCQANIELGTDSFGTVVMLQGNYGETCYDMSDYSSIGGYAPGVGMFHGGGSVIAAIIHCPRSGCYVSPPTQGCLKAQAEMTAQGESMKELYNELQSQPDQMDSSHSNPKASSVAAQVQAEGYQGMAGAPSVLLFYVELGTLNWKMKQLQVAKKNVENKCTIVLPT